MKYQPPNNHYNPQPSFNQNYIQQPMPNPEDILDPTNAMIMALVLMVKAFKLNYSTPIKNNQRILSNPRNRQIAQPGIAPSISNQNANHNRNGNVVAARAEGNENGNNGNQIRCYNYRGLVHYARNCTIRPRRRDATYLQTQMLIAKTEKEGIQLQAEEFELMAAIGDIDEIEDVNANCVLMANLQQASASEEKYTEILKPINEPQQDQQNNSNVISEDASVELNGGPVESYRATVEEISAYFESLYNILATEVEKVNQIN
ncbi:hypothetical protein Tco_0164438 [Tanacetum coccineum]